jgi:hypothetical protein
MDVLKVDLGKHMFHLLQPPCCWGRCRGVTVRAPEAGRCLCSTHPQVGQVIGTCLGSRDGHEVWDGLLERGMGVSAACERRGTEAIWDADSGHGMQCGITRGSCIWMRRPSGRPGTRPSILYIYILMRGDTLQLGWRTYEAKTMLHDWFA